MADSDRIIWDQRYSQAAAGEYRPPHRHPAVVRQLPQRGFAVGIAAGGGGVSPVAGVNPENPITSILGAALGAVAVMTKHEFAITDRKMLAGSPTHAPLIDEDFDALFTHLIYGVTPPTTAKPANRADATAERVE